MSNTDLSADPFGAAPFSVPACESFALPPLLILYMTELVHFTDRVMRGHSFTPCVRINIPILGSRDQQLLGALQKYAGIMVEIKYLLLRYNILSSLEFKMCHFSHANSLCGSCSHKSQQLLARLILSVTNTGAI